jgi:DNA polymerase delta subunit 2
MRPEQLGALATGVVVAVRGCIDKDDNIQVAGFLFPLALSPVAPPAEASTEAAAGPFVAFASGLGFGTDLTARNHAIRFFSRQCDRKELSSGIRRLVVCGGTFAAGGTTTALGETDAVLAQLAAVLPVDLMPGCEDPTNLSLPQMAMHTFLFPKAKACRDFRLATNPHQAEVEGLRILGHAGQPVEDLLRCTRLDSSLQALTMSLEAQHLAPTAPDTLAAPPFSESDPFVIENPPDVLFSGGHASAAYEWRQVTGATKPTLCLCVPALSQQPAVVLVSLSDLRDVQVVSFGEAA